MFLTETQIGLVKTSAVRHAKSLGLTQFKIVIPEESRDWGFNFHPAYNEVVTEAEIHSGETVIALFIKDNYDIVDVIEYAPEYD